MIIGLITLICLYFIFKPFLKKGNDNIDIPQEFLDFQLSKSEDEGIGEQYNIFVDRVEDKMDTEPKQWKEYIGQEAVKSTIQETLTALEGEDIPYPHILISGSAGYGKSSLIHLLALQSQYPLIETVAGNLETKEDVYKLLAKLSKNPPYSIIFLDEAGGILKNIGEILLPIIQTFKVENKSIPYFTFAAATTDLGLLTSKLSPLVDRCKQQFVLNPYNIEELAAILQNIATRKDIKIDKEALIEISSRARETPRIALGYLDNIYYYMKANKKQFIDKKMVITKLENLGIKKGGITIRDVELLRYLSRQNKPVGMSAIQQKMNIDNKTYINNIEPFLVRKEFIFRSPRGRLISEIGREYLKEV